MKATSLGWAILVPSLAAAMGWGIRGQYGHETGAMIAGCLASLAMVLACAPHLSSLTGARAAALMTVGIGIGGAMTYGQTVGLTHDADMVGNWEALRWGMLGLAVKGSLWIGFGGVMLGMGLGGVRYRVTEVALLMLAVAGLYYLGLWLINSPYDPAKLVVPRIYFSETAEFRPGPNLKPRREVWGGLLLAWLGLMAYVRGARQDRLAFRLGWFALLAGALGFPGGQCVQACHAWNPELFQASRWKEYFAMFNWWNMMETTFGAIWGAVLGAGVWWNRHLIAPAAAEESVSCSPPWEAGLVAAHLVLLLSSEFAEFPGGGHVVELYTNDSLWMTMIPVLGIIGGRAWPYLLLFPIVAAPICGKSLRALVYGSPQLSGGDGWLWSAALPMAVLSYAAVAWMMRGLSRESAGRFAAQGLLLTTWIYFLLNTIFFDFAWPWQTWTGRTPNQILFMLCALVITGFCLRALARGRDPMARSAA